MHAGCQRSATNTHVVIMTVAEPILCCMSTYSRVETFLPKSCSWMALQDTPIDEDFPRRIVFVFRIINVSYGLIMNFHSSSSSSRFFQNLASVARLARSVRRQSARRRTTRVGLRQSVQQKLEVLHHRHVIQKTLQQAFCTCQSLLWSAC